MMIYSYSSLTMYEICPYSFFKRYILKEKGEDSIFTLSGTSTHNAIESIQLRNKTNEEAFIGWKEEMEFHEILGYKFVTEKSGNNFIESVEHYIKHFEPFEGNVFVEKEATCEINRHQIKGFIDIMKVNDDNSVDIIDLKTSTLYQPKAIEQHRNQLILYGIVAEQMGYTVNSMDWDFVKYAEIPTKMKTKNILRCDLVNEDFKDSIVYYPYNQETKQQCIDWATNIIEEIESKDDVFDEWKQNKDQFYCSRLCGYCNSCEVGKQFKKNYFNNKRFVILQPTKILQRLTVMFTPLIS